MDPVRALQLKPGLNSVAVCGANQGTTSPRIVMGVALLDRSPRQWLWPLRHEVAHVIRWQSGVAHSMRPAAAVSWACIAVAAAIVFAGVIIVGPGSPTSGYGVVDACSFLALGWVTMAAAWRREEAGTDRTVVTVFGTPMADSDAALLSEVEGRSRVPLWFRTHPRPGRRHADTTRAAQGGRRWQ